MKVLHARLRRNGLYLWGALFSLLFATLNPKIEIPRDIHNYVFVLDITQSMNVRDMSIHGNHISRLEFAKHLLGDSISKLSCGTKISIALFANGEVVPLFTPIEVCANYNVLKETLDHLDWRMAWRGSSHLRLGLLAASSSMITLKEPAQIVFLTDGEEAAPLNAITKIAFPGMQGSNGWLLVGVGSDQRSPIPKFNAQNQVIGYWSLYAIKANAPTEDSTGGRDDSIATTPGEYYLSALDEPYMKELATDIGARYIRADTPDRLLATMNRLPAAGHDRAPFAMGWLFALLATIFIVADHLPTRIGKY